jgi:hypothetical protein
MAHYAQIDENNIVINVIVAEDEYIENLVNRHSYIKTSYNTQYGEHKFGGTPLRKNFANIGMYYDPKRDAFIAASPYPSWILDEEKCIWISPAEKPSEIEGKFLFWDEASVSWQFVDLPDQEEILKYLDSYLRNPN